MTVECKFLIRDHARVVFLHRCFSAAAAAFTLGCRSSFYIHVFSFLPFFNIHNILFLCLNRNENAVFALAHKGICRAIRMAYHWNSLFKEDAQERTLNSQRWGGCLHCTSVLINSFERCFAGYSTKAPSNGIQILLFLAWIAIGSLIIIISRSISISSKNHFECCKQTVGHKAWPG